MAGYLEGGKPSPQDALKTMAAGFASRRDLQPGTKGATPNIPPMWTAVMNASFRWDFGARVSDRTPARNP
jgi:hypothetical protein